MCVKDSGNKPHLPAKPLPIQSPFKGPERGQRPPCQLLLSDSSPAPNKATQAAPNATDPSLASLNMMDCDQIHVDDVSSDDNGQDLSPTQSEVVGGQMPASFKSSIRKIRSAVRTSKEQGSSPARTSQWMEQINPRSRLTGPFHEVIVGKHSSFQGGEPGRSVSVKFPCS
ncbi:hypothetical protein P7K49_009837 [Saguinus oedipus]|uniref:Uncharacterized protein n=1 Tax=Saguinus oedipus TaxID=9490 RepID=A0ABQ9VLS4_SAGOE|nr:hypothetical protein P7K49_009837 [Saguinus oedipus]